MAKTKRTKARSKTPANQRGAAKAKSTARGRAGARKSSAKGRAKARKAPSGAKKGAGRRAPVKASSRKTAQKSSAKATRKPTPKATSSKKGAASRKTAAKARKKTATVAKRGGKGRERTLSQTPAAGRTTTGPTNPMRTRRSTGTPAGAGSSRSPQLERERRQLREVEESHDTPPSSLDMDRTASAARSGRRHMQDALENHTETSPAMTGGDVDADWEDAYAVGDEAPGGDNPTPDQDRVEDIGKALGVTYDDNEELKGSDKIAERDKHRWELDPASSDDYRDRE